LRVFGVERLVLHAQRRRVVFCLFQGLGREGERDVKFFNAYARHARDVVRRDLPKRALWLEKRDWCSAHSVRQGRASDPWQFGRRAASVRAAAVRVLVGERGTTSSVEGRGAHKEW
jgi:hypothetical protein